MKVTHREAQRLVSAVVDIVTAAYGDRTAMFDSVVEQFSDAGLLYPCQCCRRPVRAGGVCARCEPEAVA